MIRTAESRRIVGDLRDNDLLPRLARMRGGSALARGRRAVAMSWTAGPSSCASGLARRCPTMAVRWLTNAEDVRRRAALLFLALDPVAHAARLGSTRPGRPRCCRRRCPGSTSSGRTC